MAQLLKDQDAVNEVRAIVSSEEEKMRADTELVHQYAQEAEKDLSDVIPLLSAATESLYTVKKADISEIRFVLNLNNIFFIIHIKLNSLEFTQVHHI
jgi:hypothetical protein